MADLDDVSSPRRRYRMNKRASRAAATRQRIIEAARALLTEGGFHDASMEELADRAGVTRVTVYRVFGSKRAVLEALTWQELARVRLERLDAAHEQPDVTVALRELLRENCRMFDELGDALPVMLELARRDEDMASVVEATYHGRRHQSMQRLATRIRREGMRAPGWTDRRVVDALLVLTSYEAFETLTRWRGHSPQRAGDILFAMAGAFLAPTQPAPVNRRGRNTRQRG